MSGVRLSFCILFAYGALTFGIGGVSRFDWLIFGEIFLIATSTWLMLLAAAAIYLSAREIRKGSDGLRPWELVRTIAWANAVWPPLLYTTLVGLFAVFKQRVLILSPFRYDQMFSAWDRALFGFDPWRLSHPSATLTQFFGMAYYGWYAPMTLGVLACSFVVGNQRFRDRYITAFVLTWIFVGSVLAFLLPAAGPCFWDQFVGGPNPYVGLMESLRREIAVGYVPVLDTQRYLLKHYGQLAVFGGGISAMPSMHVALAALFACAAWQINRAVGIIFAVFAGVIWWASVHLGWHYFVDGLIAIPATLAVWWFCGQLYPETEAEPMGDLVPAE